MISRKPGTDILRPLTSRHADDETFGDLLILRPEGRILFLNALETGEKLRELIAQYSPNIVLLDMSRVFDIEYSALQMLQEREKTQANEDFTLWFAGMNPDVREVITRSGLVSQMGEDRLFPNTQEAIKEFQNQ